MLPFTPASRPGFFFDCMSHALQTLQPEPPLQLRMNIRRNPCAASIPGDFSAANWRIPHLWCMLKGERGEGPPPHSGVLFMIRISTTTACAGLAVAIASFAAPAAALTNGLTFQSQERWVEVTGPERRFWHHSRQFTQLHAVQPVADRFQHHSNGASGKDATRPHRSRLRSPQADTSQASAAALGAGFRHR